jgi:LMBR1 domain-containing protein 1
MIDIFLLVVIIILGVLLIVTNIYLLAYYCHPEDRGFGSGLFCKCVVVIGMTLSWAQVLMLPLDVSNTRGAGGEIRMDLLWQIIYISLAALVVFIIPTCSYYYESDPEWTIVTNFKYF